MHGGRLRRCADDDSLCPLHLATVVKPQPGSDGVHYDMPCPRPRQNACTLHVELNEPLIIGWAPIKSRDCSGPGNRIVGQSVLGLKGPQLLGEHFIEDCRSEEHTSELQSLMRISYAVFCLKTTTHILNV